MAIEYGVLQIERKWSAKELEDQLNAFATRGWRIICYAEKRKIIFARKLAKEE